MNKRDEPTTTTTAMAQNRDEIKEFKTYEIVIQFGVHIVFRETQSACVCVSVLRYPIFTL